tara:strand:- start:77423 stop:78481 length:1059 start_codon:yes stop_codon:yes gene_type:complete
MNSKKIKDSDSFNYKDAGVNIEAGYELVKKIKPYVEKTKRPEILSGLGSFAALSRIPTYIKNPLLVSCTDGVGTKIEIAKQQDSYKSLGIDLVAMCVNDLISLGAEPLLFLDYYVTDKLKINTASEVIRGIAKGCEISGCSLVGGETAEHPESFPEDSFDLAGFCVGVVDEKRIIHDSLIQEGNVLVGISSSGFHSNGFSLLRKIIDSKEIDLNRKFNDLTLGKALLLPTNIYVKEILQLINKVKISGIAHITGGGLYENIPRMLPKGYKAEIEFNIDDWPAKDLFGWVQSEANLSLKEMLKTFNCGMGMVLAIDKEDEGETLDRLNSGKFYTKKIGYIKISSGNKEQLEIV